MKRYQSQTVERNETKHGGNRKVQAALRRLSRTRPPSTPDNGQQRTAAENGDGREWRLQPGAAFVQVPFAQPAAHRFPPDIFRINQAKQDEQGEKPGDEYPSPARAGRLAAPRSRSCGHKRSQRDSKIEWHYGQRQWRHADGLAQPRAGQQAPRAANSRLSPVFRGAGVATPAWRWLYCAGLARRIQAPASVAGRKHLSAWDWGFRL